MSELTPFLRAVAATASRVEHENRAANRYTARDFTPFRFLSGWGEVPFTRMLAFFLDPNEDHGQGTLFQELFVQKLRKLPAIGARLPAGSWQVEAERRHAGYGQLNLLLTAADKSFGICLENKPRDQTIDQPQQLASYRKFLQLRHGERYLLLYLSREKRQPSSDSLTPDDQIALASTGHYANITYRDFVLSLLDAWYQAVYPESLRTFLRQLRHHIEEWLQFESTKPAQLMQDQEIATELARSAEYVQTAFDIQAALPTLRSQLLQRLTQELLQRLPSLSGAAHWKDVGFFNANARKPFLIRRHATPSSLPTDLPWGRYAIGLEFDAGKLFYGIRFDKANWHDGDTDAKEWLPEAPAWLAAKLGTSGREWTWWPWWDWAGPETDQKLYPLIASGQLLAGLQPKIEQLAQLLDEYCQTHECK